MAPAQSAAVGPRERDALRWLIGGGHATAGREGTKDALFDYYARARPARTTQQTMYVRNAAGRMLARLEAKGLVDSIGVTRTGRRAAQ